MSHILHSVPISCVGTILAACDVYTPLGVLHKNTKRYYFFNIITIMSSKFILGMAVVQV